MRRGRISYRTRLHREYAGMAMGAVAVRTCSLSSLVASLVRTASQPLARRMAQHSSGSRAVTFCRAAAANRSIGNSADSLFCRQVRPPASAKSWRESLASESKTSVNRLPSSDIAHCCASRAGDSADCTSMVIAPESRNVLARLAASWPYESAAKSEREAKASRRSSSDAVGLTSAATRSAASMDGNWSLKLRAKTGSGARGQKKPERPTAGLEPSQRTPPTTVLHSFVTTDWTPFAIP